MTTQSPTAIELANDIAQLRALVEDNDDITVEQIAETLEGIQLQLEDKLDGLMAYVRHLEGMSTTCKVEAERLNKRKTHFENTVSKLREYVLACLKQADITSLKTARNTLTRRKGRARVVIDNIDLLAPNLIEICTTVVPIKDKIKTALYASGEEAISGARLEMGPETLQVR